MIRFLRNIFKKKKSKKILELTEDIINPNSNPRIHRFSKFNDSHYCTIMGFHSKESEGTVDLDIAWRTKGRVNIGDKFIISNGLEIKTLRIKKIISDDSDVKLGIAVTLQ
jgi:hypothetical protein